ncbi:MAG TPA: HD domain-containing phosphohydrolase [Acidimicrobiales bacterium]|nr:HD domain-containing phosphohydrolase [Acidimicrobiales bacterium]
MYDTIASHLELLPALQRAETVYDRGTAQHSARVGKISALVGEVLGLPSADLGVLTWVAVLHDVGKLTVSERILQKQRGRFSSDEWSELRRHTLAGEALVLALGPRLWPMAAAVRSHHERWDGSGYPDGLAGEHIPQLARIVAVADAYDLLTHEQPYRHQSLVHDAAVEVVASGAGTKFEPRVVEAFVRLDQRGLLAPITHEMQHRPQAVSALSAARRVSGTTRRRRSRRRAAVPDGVPVVPLAPFGPPTILPPVLPPA